MIKKYSRTPMRWYRRFNKKFFQGLLPDVPVFWGKEMSLIAQIQYDKDWIPERIWINVELQKWPAQAAMALLHEMAHCEVTCLRRMPRVQHGPEWMRVMRRLSNEGAFDCLW